MLLFPIFALLTFVVLRLAFRGRTRTLLLAALVVGLVVELLLEWLALHRQ